MAVPTTATNRAYQWYQNTYKTWVYEIPSQQYFSNDSLRVAYSSMYGAWMIWINHHEVGKATTLEEAQDLAMLLYKLHPDLRYEKL